MTSPTLDYCFYGLVLTIPFERAINGPVEVTGDATLGRSCRGPESRKIPARTARRRGAHHSFWNRHHDPCYSILLYSAPPLQGLISTISATSLRIYWRKLKCRFFRPGPSSAQLSVCSKAGHHFRHSPLPYAAEDTLHTSSQTHQTKSRQPPSPRAWRGTRHMHTPMHNPCCHASWK